MSRLNADRSCAVCIHNCWQAYSCLQRYTATPYYPIPTRWQWHPLYSSSCINNRARRTTWTQFAVRSVGLGEYSSLVASVSVCRVFQCCSIRHPSPPPTGATAPIQTAKTTTMHALILRCAEMRSSDKLLTENERTTTKRLTICGDIFNDVLPSVYRPFIGHSY